MVASYGMSGRIGAVAFESGHDEVFIGRTMSQGRSYSEAVAAQIDEEIKAVLADAYRRCEEILNSHRKQLDAVAEYLLEYETMDRAAFLAVMEGKPLPLPTPKEKAEKQSGQAGKAKSVEVEEAKPVKEKETKPKEIKPIKPKEIKSVKAEEKKAEEKKP